MTISFYMSHHVPSAITEGLRSKGVDVVTAYEDGAEQYDDDRLLARASELGRVLFSQDDDLLAVAQRWIAAGKPFAGLIYGHQRALAIGRAVQDLELIAKASQPDEMQSRVQFLPLR